LTDSESEAEDPEAALKHQMEREKRKRNQDLSAGNTRKIRKLVVREKLPSQSSALCRSIRNFVQFMMGVPASIAAFPVEPTPSEWNSWHHWAENRYNKMMKHLDNFTETHKETPKPTFKKMYSDEVARIRKKISPPPFNPAPDVSNSNINIPINVKKACEQDIQLAGFGRVTFEWNSRSFTASPWNATLGSILMKHYYKWAKSQPGTIWEDVPSMEKILDRWVRGKGREMKKGNVVGEKSAEELRADKSKKTAITRMKTKVSHNFI
jgi:hypothetical protein